MEYILLIVLVIANTAFSEINLKNHIYLKIKEERPINSIIMQNLCEHFNSFINNSNETESQIENIDILTDSNKNLIKLFSVNREECNLIVANRIDREYLCYEKLCDCDKCLIKLDILLTFKIKLTGDLVQNEIQEPDLKATNEDNSALITFDIEVEDINDNKPVFSERESVVEFNMKNYHSNKDYMNVILPQTLIAKDADSNLYDIKNYTLDFLNEKNRNLLSNLVKVNYNLINKKNYLTSWSMKEFASKCKLISNCRYETKGASCCEMDLMAYDKGEPALYSSVRLTIIIYELQMQQLPNHLNSYVINNEESTAQKLPFFYTMKLIDQIKISKEKMIAHQKNPLIVLNGSMSTNISLQVNKASLNHFSEMQNAIQNNLSKKLSIGILATNFKQPTQPKDLYEIGVIYHEDAKNRSAKANKTNIVKSFKVNLNKIDNGLAGKPITSQLYLVDLELEFDSLFTKDSINASSHKNDRLLINYLKQDLIVNFKITAKKPSNDSVTLFELIDCTLGVSLSFNYDLNFVNLNLDAEKSNELLMLRNRTTFMLILSIFAFISIFLIMTSIYCYVNKYRLKNSLKNLNEMNVRIKRLDASEKKVSNSENAKAKNKSATNANLTENKANNTYSIVDKVAKNFDFNSALKNFNADSLIVKNDEEMCSEKQMSSDQSLQSIGNESDLNNASYSVKDQSASRCYDTGFMYTAHLPNGQKAIIQTNNLLNPCSNNILTNSTITTTLSANSSSSSSGNSVNLNTSDNDAQSYLIDSPFTGKSYHVSKYIYNGHYV